MFAFGLAGCETTLKLETIISLVIQNKTGSVISDVRLKVSNTGNLVSCSSIPPDGECSFGFQQRESQNNPVIISWVQNEKAYSHRLSADMIGHQHSELPLTIYLNILDYGAIQAAMK
ncbi:MAG: hypothetical protein ACI936_001054 [Paraglaciecola sp.]|jgi:hypothetical protein